MEKLSTKVSLLLLIYFVAFASFRANHHDVCAERASFVRLGKARVATTSCRSDFFSRPLGKCNQRLPETISVFSCSSRGGSQEEPEIDDERNRAQLSRRPSSENRLRPQLQPSGRRIDGNKHRPTSASTSSSTLLSRFAQQSLELSGKAVSATVKKSGKAAYHLLRPKHVEMNELLGLWRLDQQIVLDGGNDDDDVGLEATANIEMIVAPDGKTILVIVYQSEDSDELQNDEDNGNDDDDDVTKRQPPPPQKYKQEQTGKNTLRNNKFRTRLLFTPATTFNCAKVEFDARAFLIEDTDGANRISPSSSPQQEPLPPLYFYRGYVGRKIADKSVIKIKGKIYRKIKNNRWRREPYRYIPMGTFVARRRMQFDDDDNTDDDDHDDEWETINENDEEMDDLLD